MKLLLSLLFAFTPPVHADPLADRTPRMAAIEKKFNVVMGAILRGPGHPDYWVFFEIQPSSTYGFIPIAVPKDASDHDVGIAQEAAENTAAFYDDQIKREKPAASPTPDHSFTVPTKPPGEERL